MQRACIESNSLALLQAFALTADMHLSAVMVRVLTPLLRLSLTSARTRSRLPHIGIGSVSSPSPR